MEKVTENLEQKGRSQQFKNKGKDAEVRFSVDRFQMSECDPYFSTVHYYFKNMCFLQKSLISACTLFLHVLITTRLDKQRKICIRFSYFILLPKLNFLLFRFLCTCLAEIYMIY